MHQKTFEQLLTEMIDRGIELRAVPDGNGGIRITLLQPLSGGRTACERMCVSRESMDGTAGFAVALHTIERMLPRLEERVAEAERAPEANPAG